MGNAFSFEAGGAIVFVFVLDGGAIEDGIGEVAIGEIGDVWWIFEEVRKRGGVAETAIRRGRLTEDGLRERGDTASHFGGLEAFGADLGGSFEDFIGEAGRDDTEAGVDEGIYFGDAIGGADGDNGVGGDRVDRADTAGEFAPADEFSGGLSTGTFAGVGEVSGDGAEFDAEAVGGLGVGKAGGDVFAAEAHLAREVTYRGDRFHGIEFSANIQAGKSDIK